jgi:hypothetical protein
MIFCRSPLPPVQRRGGWFGLGSPLSPHSELSGITKKQSYAERKEAAGGRNTYKKQPVWNSTRAFVVVSFKTYN